MKIDRLIGMITYLLQVEKTTAPELARRFEVSRRTIMRDVESLSGAGIPIVTVQGGGGGISIMEGYRLDKSLLSREDLQNILAGLQSIRSVSNPKEADLLLDKLAPSKGGIITLNEIMSIDLSSFDRDSLADKIECLKNAIGQKRLVAFRYYYNKGEADKVIEPCQIVYKWSDWYLFGFCREKQDFRLYKLSRLWELSVCEEIFAQRQIPPEKKKLGSHMRDDYFVTAIYQASEKYKLIEEYGPDAFTVLPDGRLLTCRGFTNPEDAALWFLGFGSKVEILEPKEMKQKLRIHAENILTFYQGT